MALGLERRARVHFAINPDAAKVRCVNTDFLHRLFHSRSGRSCFFDGGTTQCKLNSQQPTQLWLPYWKRVTGWRLLRRPTRSILQIIRVAAAVLRRSPIPTRSPAREASSPQSASRTNAQIIEDSLRSTRSSCRIWINFVATLVRSSTTHSRR